MTIKIPRELTEFVTPEGILSFLFLYPGQAQKSFNAGSYAFKVEWSGDIGPQEKIVQAVRTVATTFAPANPEAHVFGRDGRLKRLNQQDMPGRDQSKYPYAIDKYMLGFSQVYTPKMLGMEGLNLTDPANQAKFNMALNAKAPGAYRFAIPSVGADIARIEQINIERMQNGLKPYPEDKYHTVLIPLASHEIWPGCWGRVSGRAYWNQHAKPATVHLALTHVLMTRTGDRLVGEASPDASFAGFAPPADMAPNQPSLQDLF